MSLISIGLHLEKRAKFLYQTRHHSSWLITKEHSHLSDACSLGVCVWCPGVDTITWLCVIVWSCDLVLGGEPEPCWVVFCQNSTFPRNEDLIFFSLSMRGLSALFDGISCWLGGAKPSSFTYSTWAFSVCFRRLLLFTCRLSMNFVTANPSLCSTSLMLPV